MANAASSYPVLWLEPDGQRATGKLVPGRETLELQGSRAGRLVERTLAYRDVDGVRIGRTPPEVLNGRPTLVLERHGAPALRVLPLSFGLLHELADLIAELCRDSEPVAQIAVVLPLKPGALETAQALVAEGPPFHPDDKSLAQHDVFLTEHEVIFVFSGTDARHSVRRIVSDASLWQTIGDWSACLDGPPRLAEAGYTWTRHT